MKNKKILAISAIATVLVGSTLFYVEKQSATYTKSEKVYVAKTTINKGDPIKKSNFELKNRTSDVVTKDITTEKDKGTISSDNIAKDTIYRGEMLNKNRVISKTDPLAATLQLKKGEVEFSINVQSLDNYAGTYRSGDIVELIFTPLATTQNSNPQAQVLIKKIKVLGAIDSSGKYLSSSDKNVLATGISFAGTENDVKAVSQSQDRGKFKIAKINID